MPSHPPGAVFYVDSTYLVRLIGHDEQTRKPWCAVVDIDGHLGSVQPFSLASLPPRLSSAVVPEYVSIAVAHLLEDPSIYHIARRPRPLSAIASSPLPLSSIANCTSQPLHPGLQTLPALLGPLRSPLPPSRPLRSILQQHPGAPACPSHLRHLQTWGFFAHPLATHRSAVVVFERVHSAIKLYASRLSRSSGTTVDPYHCHPPPDWVERHIHGVSSPCPTLSASHHFIHLDSRTRFSVAAYLRILGHYPTGRAFRYILSLSSLALAQRLACQSISLWSASTLFSAILRSPAFRMKAPMQCALDLSVHSCFSGLELSLASLQECLDLRDGPYVTFSLTRACDFRLTCVTALRGVYPGVSVYKTVSGFVAKPMRADILIAGISPAPSLPYSASRLASYLLSTVSCHSPDCPPHLPAGIPCNLVSSLRRICSDADQRDYDLDYAAFLKDLHLLLNAIPTSKYKAIILEDVTGLLTPKHHVLFNDVCNKLLKASQYFWAVGLLDSYLLGSVDARNRVFFVGLQRRR